MAHYALLDENNIVTNVIVGREETDDVPESFETWEEYYADLFSSTVKRCSYNTYGGVHTLGGTAFRGNYPGIGDKYYSDKDVFSDSEAPFPSWTLDDNGLFNPPTAMPLDGKPYIWDEDNTEWVRDPDIADEDIVELPDPE